MMALNIQKDKIYYFYIFLYFLKAMKLSIQILFAFSNYVEYYESFAVFIKHFKIRGY